MGEGFVGHHILPPGDSLTSIHRATRESIRCDSSKSPEI